MNFIKKILSDTNQLQRIVVLAAATLVVMLVSFGVYYYNDRYVRSGDVSPISQSINELEEAVRADPQNMDLRLALAENYLLNQNYDKAIEQAVQVLQTDPNKDGAYLILGVAYSSMEQYQPAIEPLKKFIEIHEAQPMANVDNALETALYYLGDCYMKLNQPQDAIPQFTRALQINRTDADAFYKLGDAYRLTSQHEQAIQSYESAVLFVPNFTEAYQGMVDSFTAQGKKDYAAYARGMVAYSVKDYDTAVAEMEPLANVLTDFAPLHLGLGLSYEGLGDLLSAKVSVLKALELDPENFAAQQALGRIDAASK